MCKVAPKHTPVDRALLTALLNEVTLARWVAIAGLMGYGVSMCLWYAYTSHQKCNLPHKNHTIEVTNHMFLGPDGGIVYILVRIWAITYIVYLVGMLTKC